MRKRFGLRAGGRLLTLGFSDGCKQWFGGWTVRMVRAHGAVTILIKCALLLALSGVLRMRDGACFNDRIAVICAVLAFAISLACFLMGIPRMP